MAQIGPNPLSGLRINFLGRQYCTDIQLWPRIGLPPPRDSTVKMLVSGGKKFADLKLMDRALDTLHRRKRIQQLVTGGLSGAQEMAYYWALRNRIPFIVTFPMQPDLTGRLDSSRWNHDVLKQFVLDGLVVFPGRSETEHLAELAESAGLRVWRVPENWRG